MSIQEQKITEAAVAESGVQSQPDKLTGTAAQNKKVFDNLVTAVVREKFNALLDELTGAAAAAQLGITTIPGFSADNIQTALEQIVQAMQDVTQGSVADGSITLAKLAAEVTAIALGGAAASHTHGAGDINSGVLDADRIPVLDGTKLGTGSVGTAQLGAAVVTSDKLAALSVLATHIANGAVTTQKLAPEAVTRAKMAIDAFTLADNAGAHNAVYRGNNLGSAVTDAQWAAIQSGTFENLFIGDYWTINGVTWRIAAFDYYLNTGDTACTTHHVTIVPDEKLYDHVMNDTNTTVGAYVGSKMYTEGLNTAKTTINNAFGSAHILNHRQYLKNAVTDNYESGGAWYDSTVELMTEQNVYGGKIFSNCLQGTNWARLSTIDKSQFPLFAHRPEMISDVYSIFLRDVASSETFCYTQNNGVAEHVYASTAQGVRPAFSIKA